MGGGVISRAPPVLDAYWVVGIGMSESMAARSKQAVEACMHKFEGREQEDDISQAGSCREGWI